MGEMRNAYDILVGRPERDNLEELDTDEKIILERILCK
jgi:hypothetical protein